MLAINKWKIFAQSFLWTSILKLSLLYRTFSSVSPLNDGSVGWDCRICQLHLCGGLRFLQWVSWIWQKTIWLWGSSNIGAIGNVEYPFIAIALGTTLAQNGSTWKGPIYGSNRSVWHLNWIQINDLCLTELL